MGERDAIRSSPPSLRRRPPTRGGGSAADRLADFLRQVVDRKRRAVGQNDGALDRVLELADVAGPVVGDQGLDRLGVEVGDRLPVRAACRLRKYNGELEDVFPPLAQGGVRQEITFSR